MIVCRILFSDNPDYPKAFWGGTHQFYALPRIGEHIMISDSRENERHLHEVLNVVHSPVSDDQTPLIFVQAVEWPRHIQQADF
jgi:hypothetical protein